MAAQTSIVDLSTEVLCLIINQLPLSSHFDFACTCRRLAAASQYILPRHQEAATKYRIACDLDPTTVLFLLRSAFGGDPLPAWHVRSFEVWRDRTTWAEWIPYSLFNPIKSSSDDSFSDLQVPLHQLEEIGSYLDWYDEYTCRDIDRDMAYSQIETGHDGLLKALLFAKCPRLRDLKFITRSLAKGSTLSWLTNLIAITKSVQEENEQLKPPEEVSWWDRNKDKSVEKSEIQNDYDQIFQDDHQSETESNFDREWAKAYMQWTEEQVLQDLQDMEICEQDIVADYMQDHEVRSLDGSISETTVDLTQWPAGFTSIRSVAVGVVSETWMDYQKYPPSISLLARLLRLPAIDTLYYNGLRCDDDEEEEFIYSDDEDSDEGDDGSISSVWESPDLPPHCSSVKHLFFESIGYALNNDFRGLLCEAPRKLQTIAFRNGDQYTELHYADYILQDLARTQGSSLQSFLWYGYDSSSIQWNDDYCYITSMEELDQFHAIKQLSLTVEDFTTRLDQDDAPRHEGRDEFYIPLASEKYPSSIECLVLWGQACESERMLLERAIIKMIEDGRYRNLKAIHLAIYQSISHCDERGKAGIVSFEKAVTVGKAAGIDVLDSTNRFALHQISFPERVDQYDLKTGKYPEGRPSDYVFNSYWGSYEPPQSVNYVGCT